MIFLFKVGFSRAYVVILFIEKSENQSKPHQIKSNFGFCCDGIVGVPGEILLRVENQATQTLYDAQSGNRTQAPLVEGGSFHYEANPARYLNTLPSVSSKSYTLRVASVSCQCKLQRFLNSILLRQEL